MLTKFFLLIALTTLFHHASAYEINDSAENKLQFLNTRIINDQYSGRLPDSSPGTFSMLKLLRPSYLVKTLNHQDDLMIIGREKLIHTFGVVANIEFIPSHNECFFAGMVCEGAKGLVRASLATMDKNFTPAMAFKFPVTNATSVDIIVMFSVDGQGQNRNFFANTFSNTIPDSNDNSLKPLEMAFKAAARIQAAGTGIELDPQTLNVSNFGLFSQDGSEFRIPPGQRLELLEFRPTYDVKNIISSHSTNDFRKDLALIPEGTIIYQVFARKRNQNMVKEIGVIKLNSRFLASRFADEKLHFKHSLNALD